MTNLIIAGGTRRERSQTLLGQLEGGTGRRWLVAVPCGLPYDMPDGIHGIGLNDLDGAFPMGVSCIGCERLDLDRRTAFRPGMAA